MKVLVACESSGIVRDAFREAGHDAWSCDLVPSEKEGPHLQTDVRAVLDQGWDLMIAHPPCTFLASSGARWFKQRREQQAIALLFVKHLMDCAIPRIAIENPVSVISTFIRKPDQIIQPREFGHEERKTTCLWLKGLPPLKPIAYMPYRYRNVTPSGQNILGPSATRQRERARTYPGVAFAMAQQWGVE